MPKIQENFCGEPMEYIFNHKNDLTVLLKSLYICEKNTERNWSEVIKDLFLGFELELTDQENDNHFVKIVTDEIYY